MMKFIQQGLTALMLGAASAFTVAAQEAAPIITFHTNLYELAGTANSFTISLGARQKTFVDVDCGYGRMESEIGFAEFNNETGEIEGTVISCTVGPEGIVKIYGDPKMIDFIDFEGIYMSSIEWPQMTDVEILNLEHNQLQGIDLSHMKKLNALYISDNPGTKENPIIIGADKPELMILSAAMIEWLDPDFDIDTYPQLRSFMAYSTPTLTHLTPSGAPLLIQLSADSTNLTDIDVSSNQHLQILNVSGTKVSKVDVTQNALLTELYCAHDGSANADPRYMLTELDLSGNPRLQRLFCSGNLLTELDVTYCPQLLSLYANNNRLTSLNIEGCDALYEMSIYNNFLNFNTCPLPDPNYIDYYYEQRAVPVARSFKTGSSLDLTRAVIRPDADTDCILYTFDRLNPSEITPLDIDAYSYKNGVITFNRALPDSVYAAFYCNAFPDWILTTTNFMVKDDSDFGKPSPAVSIKTSMLARDQKLRVGFAGASEENPVEFFVDFGDGELKSFFATSPSMPAEPNVVGERKGATTIIYTNDGTDMTALGANSFRMNGIDLSYASALVDLELTDCALPEIDLLWNPALSRIDLSGNQLKVLDLTNDVIGYSKNHLTDISAANNQISDFRIVDRYGLANINLANNRLAEFILTHGVDLKTVDLSGNLIEEISISDCESMTDFNIAGNLISELIVPDYVPLEKLDIRNNNFSFPTLPSNGCAQEFLYAPQNKITIPTKAPSINLSSQNLEIDGNKTQYTWRYAADGTPVETEGRIKAENGRFLFTDPNIGEIYCTMTNAAYPAFDGENALATTVVLTAEPPTNKFLSFKTVDTAEVTLSIAADTNNREIYIDWNNSGDYEQYLLRDSYTLFSANAKAGIEVGCYSYEETDPVKVFSVVGAKLSDIDASQMKSVVMLGFSQAGLDESSNIKWPTVPSFTELRLDNNNFENFELNQLPGLTFISMVSNKLKSIDLSPAKNLEVVYFSDNEIEEAKFDNPHIWELGLAGNKLTSFSLDNLSGVQQLWLGGNNLESIDVSGAPGLTTLNLLGNRLTFMTLPKPSALYKVYNYLLQQPLSVTVEDGCVVDLSEQSNVDSSETTYRWFIDSPMFDEENNLIGEELMEGVEYTIDNGVTTFLDSFQNLMCVMTNPVFPDLYLYTDFINVAGSSVEELERADNADSKWYDLQGRLIPRPTESGLYIRRTGSKTEKIRLR